MRSVYVQVTDVQVSDGSLHPVFRKSLLLDLYDVCVVYIHLLLTCSD